MSTLKITDSVGNIVAQRPALARAFEQAGIEYCCGGRKSFEEACREKGLDALTFLAALEEASSSAGEGSVVDATAMSLTELADHIEQTHHSYLRSEFPRLDAMIEKVASVHGDREPRLREVRETFLALVGELSSHMIKEEQILFPMVRQLEESEGTPAFQCGSLANSIEQMEFEHEVAGTALEQLRELTDGYSSPEWACNTYRAMLDALAHLERDLHQHIHKENNILFPRVLAGSKKKQ